MGQRKTPRRTTRSKRSRRPRRASMRRHYKWGGIVFTQVTRPPRPVNGWKWEWIGAVSSLRNYEKSDGTGFLDAGGKTYEMDRGDGHLDVYRAERIY